MEEQSQKIISAVITVMIVVILTVVASLVIGTFLDSPIFNNIIISGTNTNESLGIVNNITNSTFNIISTQPLATCSSTILSNSTGGETLSANNYTFYPGVCKLILNDSSNYIGENLTIAYDFAYDSNSSIIGVDVDSLKNQFGLFVTGLIAFLAIIGTIVGVVWLVYYVKALFDKKSGLQSISA